MGKKCLLMILAGLLLGGFRAYADDTKAYVPPVAQLEAAFQFELTTRFELYGKPKATSYYDDLVDHYEQDQLMRDTIADGID